MESEIILSDIKNKRLLSSGQAAIMAVLFFLVVSVVLALAFTFVVVSEVSRTHDIVTSKQSYALSEAGAEDVTFRVQEGLTYDAAETVTLGGYSTEVTTIDAGNTIDIISEASVTSNFRTTKVRLTDDTDAVQFFYGVQVGEGGLGMGENAKVQGAGGAAGNVYSNGPVTGDQGSTVTGGLTVATSISEDNQAGSSVCNQDQDFGQVNPVIDMAQSFRPTQDGTLAKVSLYIKKVGNPPDRTARITNDSGGSPAQNSLANATIQSILVGANYAWIDVVFPAPPLLTAGNTYWIVFDTSRDVGDYWVWCKDSNQGFGNGEAKYSQDWDDDPWVLVVGDLAFKTYFGSGLGLMDGVVVEGDARAHNIVNSKVCGDAYYQTIDAASLNFLNNPAANICPAPLTSGTGFGGQADPPLGTFSISQANIDKWKLDSDPDNSPHVGDLVINVDTSIGPEKITGNLIMNSNQKILNVTGTLYVQGYIEISNGSKVKCDPAYGQFSCIIITDKWIHSENNGIFEGSGQANSYVLFLSTSVCDGSGAGAPCTHHDAAIDLHNNAEGAIFYTTLGLVTIHNGVEATEVTAYKLYLDNTAIVRYEQGLISAQFSAGPSGGRSI